MANANRWWVLSVFAVGAGAGVGGVGLIWRATIRRLRPYRRLMDNNSPKDNEKLLAVAAHLSGFLAFIPLANLLGPLLIWLIGRKDSQFIDEHGKESLNFQISLLIYSLLPLIILLVAILPTAMAGLMAGGSQNLPEALVAGMVASWGMALLGFLAFGILSLVAVVLMIIAAINAAQGQAYQYPLTIRFIR
jgi:uncharacterized protein